MRREFPASQNTLARTQDRHALTLDRPRPSQHTVPSRGSPGAHARQARARTHARPPSPVAAHRIRLPDSLLIIPFHIRHAFCGVRIGISRVDLQSLSHWYTPQGPRPLTLARARPLSHAPPYCQRTGHLLSRRITGRLTADTATQAQLVKRRTQGVNACCLSTLAPLLLRCANL